MTLKIEDKKKIVATVNAVAAKALSAVVAQYRGLSVARMTELRNSARSAGVYLQVVRNTLLSLAVIKTEFECMQEIFTGPIIIAFALEDPGAAARLLRDFAKTNDKLIITGLAVGGKLLAAHQIDALASLPTREQALSQLLSVIQAPVTQLVRTLVEPYAMLARVTAAIRDQKQAA